MIKKLKRYIEKRNFLKTPEPSGEKLTKSESKLIFSVQHHVASHDHFDFRLQWGDVLVSFAVPKGPSFNPNDKRLAVHVEDHPLDYATFEGTIPKGEYGGGTVLLWDTGYFLPKQNFDKGLKKGSLKFELFGKRLKGGWTLVRLKNDEKNWLLIKEKDQFAQNCEGISKYKASVLSGKTIKQITEENDLKDITKKTEKNPFKSVDLQLCTLAKNVPQDDDYIFEVKYDGYRIVAFIENNDVKLFTRNHTDFSQKFPKIVEQLKLLAGKKAMVFDGEVILPDQLGRPDFQALQNHMKSGSDDVVYMIFDLLALNGKDLRDIPLWQRKEKLQSLLSKNNYQNIKFAEHFEGDGQKFFKAVEKMGLEGVVAKNKFSKYVGTRNEDWLKIKCYRRQEFVVGGYLSSEKKKLSALLLGVYEKDKLKFVGKCGTGFDEKESEDLLSKFEKNLSKKSPFTEKDILKLVTKKSVFTVIKERSGSAEKKVKIFWLKPKFVAEIQFAELTKDGVLRQASFKGLRQDKKACDVVFETPKVIEQSKKKSKTEDFCIFDVKFTHPDKVIYKDKKVTKKDVANYYAQVSERMLSVMKGRLLSVVRCHNGALTGFYKKHPTVEKEGVKRVFVQNDEGKKQEYFSVENERGLLQQVQLGTLEFHMWGSKVSSLEKPDFMVFDLDPDKSLNLRQIRQGVKDLKKVLDKLGLKSFLKTSGGKGYHICVPFTANADWQVFHDFSEKVAHILEDKYPERYTTNIRKENRHGKIFIDFMRNTRSATSVAPYSLRARAGAKVSCPIFWSELDKIAPDDIDINSALLRLKKSDPWKDFEKVEQSLK